MSARSAMPTDHLAVFSRSASWPWGDVVLHVGDRTTEAGRSYWAIAMAGREVIFETRLGDEGDYGTSEYIGRIDLDPTAVIVVDAEVAILSETTTHARGSDHPHMIVLTRDGVVRVRVPGRVDRAVPPRREGRRLRLQREPDTWHPEPVQWIDLDGAQPPVDPFAHAATMHGYHPGERLDLAGRCRGMRARAVADGRALTLLSMPPMDDATRDKVLGDWGEQTSAPLPGVLAAHGWHPAVEPGGPGLLVLDAVGGYSLATSVQKGAPLSSERARRVVETVSRALTEAHRRGRWHGYLAPDRVWFDRGDAVWLIEVGLERALVANGVPSVGEGRSSLQRALWAWAAPEVLGGGGDARSDVWSFALLVFWMRTGVGYWREERDAEALRAEIVDGPLARPSERARRQGRTGAEIPDGAFDAWFRRCVARDPSERFSDFGEACVTLPW